MTDDNYYTPLPAWTADGDKWNTCTQIARCIASLVRVHLDQELHGYPAELVGGPSGLSAMDLSGGDDSAQQAEWRSILTKIADGFQAFADEDTSWAAGADGYEEAMELFARYLPSIWD